MNGSGFQIVSVAAPASASSSIAGVLGPRSLSNARETSKTRRLPQRHYARRVVWNHLLKQANHPGRLAIKNRALKILDRPPDEFRLGCGPRKHADLGMRCAGRILFQS